MSLPPARYPAPLAHSIREPAVIAMRSLSTTVRANPLIDASNHDAWQDFQGDLDIFPSPGGDIAVLSSGSPSRRGLPRISVKAISPSTHSGSRPTLP